MNKSDERHLQADPARTPRHDLAVGPSAGQMQKVWALKEGRAMRWKNPDP